MSLEQFHLVRLLKAETQHNPDAIALKGFEMAAPWDAVSRKTFDHSSDSLAMQLIAGGLGVQARVGIMSNNCPQWTVADVASLKARAVVVPIYPTSTLEQAAYILNDAEASWLFVDNAERYGLACELRALCPQLKSIVVFDDAVTLAHGNDLHLSQLLMAVPDGEAAKELGVRLAQANLDDLLTLIYTSGTTGEPKGVMLPHRAIASTIRQHDKRLAFTEGDVSLAFLPLSHIFERAWSFYVLGRGGCNVYLTDTNRVKEAIAAVRPHTLCVVPRFLEKVYSAVQDKLSRAPASRKALFAWAMSVGGRRFEVAQGRAKGGVLLSLQARLADKLVGRKIRDVLGGRLKFMPCGGAALNTDVGAFFNAVNVPVLCGYGLTETTATVTCNTLDNRVPGSNGQCLPEVEIRIGENDEILVRGDTVMTGYYKRPEDTASAFDNGWFKTGDAGRLDEAGNLFITDRIKELMKTSNGKYIAPQRVEGVVGRCPFIEQVAVIADARNYVTALIVPAYEALEAWAREKGLKYESPLELIRHSHVLEHFEARLKLMQEGLAGFEQIKKFTLLPDAFTTESGLITPTLKLRRKVIYHKYQREISAMYGN
ncbi:long-chain fatty acid--CoA ligase [Shewanella amazonensis]|uniref:AMP-binding family protein n=1 Tax=Shewanella amazonensis (strain ATCC BAA-1098 / SB2B) TaxID=326297 RepID=A1SBL7_SHEAM|nr:long-chain fatty acid--CoA ligase [Shewanella amazonensis]ABM01774.1 AMP-binding family protein [Shewanella amazonensis SB2B]